MLCHTVERVLPYSRELLFDVAADVEHYPAFLRSWKTARITRREADRYWTEQSIALGPVCARFGSETLLNRPGRIDVTSTEAPFRSFHLSWTFEPEANGGTRARLAAELDIHSRLLERIAEPLLRGIIAETIADFETEAARVAAPAAMLQSE
jgi:coenzyme Q-binding protein COQ10